MLDGIDDIDWANLKHAYGSAADVPELIRSLLSPDEDIRRDAMYELFGNIWHQGTVYEATVFAVPFLVELLNTDQTVNKSPIACLLASIANGYGYLEVHARPEYFESDWRSILGKKGKDLDTERARELTVTTRVRQAAERHLPLIATYIADPESETRSSVAAALSAYPNHASTYLPLLESALKGEEDDEVRDEIEQAIRRLTHERETAEQNDKPEKR